MQPEGRCHPTGRAVVAAAVISATLVATISGCGGKVPQKTARVTLNDNVRNAHAVSCTQVDWLLTVDINDDSAHTRAVLQLDPDKPKLQSVNFDNFNGFTGVADEGAGKGEATFSAGSYHITGTAQRTNPENPAEPQSAPFTIDVSC